MDFKIKIRKVVTHLQIQNKNYVKLDFDKLDESELLILEEIYYFNELKNKKLEIEEKNLITDRFNSFNKILENEKFQDIDLNDDLKILYNDTFFNLLNIFNKELNIDILQNIKFKIEEQEKEKNIILSDDKKTMIYKKGIKSLFNKYSKNILENNKEHNTNLKHLQSFNNMIKLENIIKEMNQSGGNMNLVNLFKILNNVYNNDDEISDVEKEKIQILSNNINFYDEKSKKYVKKYLNYDDSEESEKELNIFLTYLKELKEIPEKTLNKVQEKFNKYKGKEVNNKELSNEIFQLNLEEKNNFDNLLNKFTSEVLSKLNDMKNEDINELKSLLKIYIENNLNNMCDKNGKLRNDLNIIEILKDINSRTFKITPEKEYKETGKILKNVFDFSNDTIPPKVSFKGGGRGELDIIYHNDFNFIGCSTTLKETISFEGNQLLNHPYKLYKISETLDFDENVDIKKTLNLLKQDSRTESFDKDFDNYNGKLGTKENLRKNLFEIKNSTYEDNIVKIRKDEKIFKKILEEISFEFHLHKKSFLSKDFKDYEKLFMKNMFMSALLNNDNNNINSENNKSDELYGFMNRIDKSFLNIPFDIEKKYETLNVSKTNKDFSELMIYTLLDKNFEELKDNEILKIYKNDVVDEKKIKKRLLNLFLFKNKNYLNITVRNLSQYITIGNNKEDLGLISQSIENIYKEKYKDRQLSTPDFDFLKEREKTLRKDIELKKEREEKLKEREEKNQEKLKSLTKDLNNNTKLNQESKEKLFSEIKSLFNNEILSPEFDKKFKELSKQISPKENKEIGFVL